MSRSPDTPCGGCGRLLHTGTGSRPDPVCRECRKLAAPPNRMSGRPRRPRAPLPLITYTCPVDQVEFQRRGKQAARPCCSRRCAMLLAQQVRTGHACLPAPEPPQAPVQPPRPARPSGPQLTPAQLRVRAWLARRAG